ncbi:ABC transporter permease subunit [Nocardioides sp. 616]|uniref:ABC transporter permease n=1 Tax=Nocardioides sp. 616 TaxID=2268090 RepID=UPI000CE347D6|nr:ABC transporter permease subunit [Nocardioides sp. 616]
MSAIPAIAVRPLSRVRSLRLPTLGLTWLTPVAGLAVLLLAWEVVARTVAADKFIVPTIPNVIRTMVDDGFYQAGVATTLSEAGRGFLWGNLAALAVAGLCLVAPPLRGFLTKVALATYCTPTIAIAPLLIVLFSPDGAKVAMAGLSVFFPTLLGALLGLEGAPRTALEFVHVSGGSRAFALARVRLRASVPEIAAALSLAAPAAVVGAMIGEYLGGDQGLGVVLVQAQQSLNVARAWAVAIEATAISAAAYLAIGAIARKLAYTVTSTEFGVLPPKPRQRGPRQVALGALRLLGSVAAVLAVWHLTIQLSGMDTFIAKTPVDVWGYLFTGPDVSANRALIATGLKETVLDASVGYVAGTVLAIVAALLFLSSRLLEGMFLPVVMTVRAVPLVAMTPIVALVFGRGLATVAVLAGAVTFVPTLVIVLAALRSIPRPATELLHVYAVSPVRSLLTVRLAYAIPALAASARIAIPGSILGAVLAEILVTGDGIGYTVATSIGRSDYVVLWTALSALTAVTATFYVLLSRLESALLSRVSQ